MQNPSVHPEGLFGVVTRLANIVSLSDTNAILHKVMSELVEMSLAQYCSIYLVPDLLVGFDETLVRDDNTISYENINKHCVVLASTNQDRLSKWLHKAFYYADESFTGLSYERKIAFNIKNLGDQNEVNFLANAIEDAFFFQKRDIYGECSNENGPMLVVPLYTDERSIGVIKLFGRKSPFTDYDERVAILGSLIASSAIRNASELYRHKNSILELIEVGAKRDIEDIFVEASKGLRDVLHGEKNQIFISSDETNTFLSLKVENGQKINITQKWGRGYGLVGWVYKTGKPLLIDDARKFNEEQILTEETLSKISDTTLINQSDRNLQRQEPYSIPIQNWPVAFLAVPITQDDEVLGVVAVHSRYGNSFPRAAPFDHSDLQLAWSFARIISNSIESEQGRLLSQLLTNMGLTNVPERLYSIVTNGITKIVSSYGCSIFEFRKDKSGQYLKLVATTRPSLIEEGIPVDLVYTLDEGKTGFCGYSKNTLILNHFGSGDVSETSMDKEINRVLSNHPKDLITRLIDDSGIQVGIIQLRRGKDSDEEVRKKFISLSSSQKVSLQGLPQSKDLSDSMKAKERSWSFVAVPIRNDTNLMGVITIGRPVPQNPFSPHDITLIEAIAERLATVLSNIYMQEQRKELFTSLAHEITTPLTGILAESENLVEVLRNQPEMQKRAKEVLTRVLRLHLLTKTILGVLSKPNFEREFKYVNIGRILRQARDLFAAEAIHKGCDINEPQSVEDPFPSIEMSELDLSIAIQNIVHNAVKYSFYPSPRQEKKRYIKLYGKFSDQSKMYYKIVIQNFGVGISQDEIRKRVIFESFVRGENATDRSRTGAGFGLAYARQIIEDMHGGRIDVTSVPLDGKAYLTTFTITLPIYKKYGADK